MIPFLKLPARPPAEMSPREQVIILFSIVFYWLVSAFVFGLCLGVFIAGCQLITHMLPKK